MAKSKKKSKSRVKIEYGGELLQEPEFMLTPGDPEYKEPKPATPPAKETNRDNTRKYLTKKKKGSIIEPVKKLKRKDDKMANDKNKTTSKKRDIVKSVAWLVEAAFRTFVGWILLTNFDHVVTTAAAFYALGTAAVIVVTHFVNAHK